MQEERLPRLYSTEGFRPAWGVLDGCVLQARTFAPGDCFWAPGEAFGRLYRIRRGLARLSVQHPTGKLKDLGWYGPGEVFPLPHETRFRIERSILLEAVESIEADELSAEAVDRLFDADSVFRRLVVEAYARMVNLLLFDSAHQSLNSALVRTANVLELLARCGADSGEASSAKTVRRTQEELAQLIGVNRANLTRALTTLREAGAIETRRGEIRVADAEKLSRFCSSESLGC